MNQLLKNATQLATICLEHCFFVVGWQMEDLYNSIIEGNENLGIDVLYIEQNPVASCIINLEENSLNVFVKNDQRKKGYGQKVVAKKLTKYHINSYETYGSQGIEGSEEFYKSCGAAFIKEGYFSMRMEEVSLLISNKITIKEIRQKRIQEFFENNH